MTKTIDFDYTKVKVKEEKLSPPRKKQPEEIIDEIIPTLFNDVSKNKANFENEDKKNVEPVKSSNEILAELFKVFNAAPPESLLNDEYLINKKNKKKNKKDKKNKKKSKKRGRSSSDEASSDDIISSKNKHKKKKKEKKSKHHKKDKIKSEKQNESSKKCEDGKSSSENIDSNSDFSISDYDENNLPKSPIAKTRIKQEKDCNSLVKEFYGNYKDDNKKESSSHHKREEKKDVLNDIPNKNWDKSKISKNSISRWKEKGDGESEISLSDEETYLKEKEKYSQCYDSSRSHDRSSRHKTITGRPRPNERERNDFYKGSSRDRDHRIQRSSSRNLKDRSRWRSRTRSRSRMRSTSRSRELGIDKKRLLEIARKNAIAMFKKGALPGTQQMSQDIKDKVLLKMRYGGKTVEDLTDFCKKLSNGENLNDISDLTSNDESDHDKDGNEKPFVHHPFVLKDRAPIVMNIKNATPIQPKSAEETKALLMQFPVSSGQQHRLNESEWVPVTPPRVDAAKPVVAGSIVPTAAKRMIQQQLTAQIPKTVFGKAIPADEKQKPAFVPVSNINTVPTTASVTTVSVSESKVPVTISNITQGPAFVPSQPLQSVPCVNILPSANSSLTQNSVQMNTPAFSISSVPPPPLPSAPVYTPSVASYNQPPEHNIFNQPKQNLDVAAIISKRLNAMRRLQENPMDAEALKIMYNAQKDMSTWASMKQVPGQFTGSTGVNILSARELSGGVQAWAKRDQMTNTAPVSGGMGMRLLQKMGWKPGEGLGRERNGALQPLLLEVKLDKRGVMSTEEDPIKKKMALQNLRKIRKGGPNSVLQQTKEVLESKHPVSLLGEIAMKKRWMPPQYELVDDKGPSHNKMFVFKVVINEIAYQPSIPSNTKKAAKAVAAKYCLQQLGILPTTANST